MRGTHSLASSQIKLLQMNENSCTKTFTASSFQSHQQKLLQSKAKYILPFAVGLFSNPWCGLFMPGAVTHQQNRAQLALMFHSSASSLKEIIGPTAQPGQIGTSPFYERFTYVFLKMKQSLKCCFTLIIAIIPFFQWPIVNREFSVLSFAPAMESSLSQDFLFGNRRFHLNHHPPLASSHGL